MSLRFLADQCVPGTVIRGLEDDGHVVIPLRKCARIDSPDPVVIAKAQELGCLLVSLNGDFSDIVNYPPAKYRGIVSLQVLNHPEAVSAILKRLKEYLRVEDQMRHYVGKLLIVEAHRVRVRQ